MQRRIFNTVIFNQHGFLPSMTFQKHLCFLKVGITTSDKFFEFMRVVIIDGIMTVLYMNTLKRLHNNCWEYSKEINLVQRKYTMQFRFNKDAFNTAYCTLRRNPIQLPSVLIKILYHYVSLRSHRIWITICCTHSVFIWKY
jgi:hypothetical protein